MTSVVCFVEFITEMARDLSKYITAQVCILWLIAVGLFFNIQKCLWWKNVSYY
jgi:hypothetical protein